MIVIDAKNLILGRFATHVAKQALLGEEVRVINCEKAIVSGRKATTIKETQQSANRGNPVKGPFIPKMADRYVRRVIRGMLPYKQVKGAQAYKRVLCYVGEPEEFKGKAESLEAASFKKLPNLKFVTVGEMLQNI
ncbi:MAG: 50S ribosomal protein L13 [Nanoarchaeota archaeon]|nr:50S ribosomal protein L13 [Nanoarchaeota archaeon]